MPSHTVGRRINDEKGSYFLEVTSFSVLIFILNRPGLSAVAGSVCYIRTYIQTQTHRKHRCSGRGCRFLCGHLGAPVGRAEHRPQTGGADSAWQLQGMEAPSGCRLLNSSRNCSVQGRLVVPQPSSKGQAWDRSAVVLFLLGAMSMMPTRPICFWMQLL